MGLEFWNFLAEGKAKDCSEKRNSYSVWEFNSFLITGTLHSRFSGKNIYKLFWYNEIFGIKIQVYILAPWCCVWWKYMYVWLMSFKCNKCKSITVWVFLPTIFCFFKYNFSMNSTDWFGWQWDRRVYLHQ